MRRPVPWWDAPLQIQERQQQGPGLTEWPCVISPRLRPRTRPGAWKMCSDDLGSARPDLTSCATWFQPHAKLLRHSVVPPSNMIRPPAGVNVLSAKGCNAKQQ